MASIYFTPEDVRMNSMMPSPVATQSRAMSAGKSQKFSVLASLHDEDRAKQLLEGIDFSISLFNVHTQALFVP